VEAVGFAGSGVPSGTLVLGDTSDACFVGSGASLAHRPGMRQQRNFIKLMGSTYRMIHEQEA
jgi:hypothetical protein